MFRKLIGNSKTADMLYNKYIYKHGIFPVNLKQCIECIYRVLFSLYLLLNDQNSETEWVNKYVFELLRAVLKRVFYLLVISNI